VASVSEPSSRARARRRQVEQAQEVGHGDPAATDAPPTSRASAPAPRPAQRRRARPRSGEVLARHVLDEGDLERLRVVALLDERGRSRGRRAAPRASGARRRQARRSRRVAADEHGCRTPRSCTDSARAWRPSSSKRLRGCSGWARPARRRSRAARPRQRPLRKRQDGREPTAHAATFSHAQLPPSPLEVRSAPWSAGRGDDGPPEARRLAEAHAAGITVSKTSWGSARALALDVAARRVRPSCWSAACPPRQGAGWFALDEPSVSSRPARPSSA